jgi:alpha-beta hydrolase superfamily lysophospholipase
MVEFADRYLPFAGFLAEHGVAVVAHDHLGHGASTHGEEDYGFFTETDGRRFVAEDLHTMNTIAHARWPGLPVVLLGHSMGSFYARWYAAQWPSTISGLILSGTGGPNPQVNIGIRLARRQIRRQGARHRSKRLQVLAFGSYLGRVENPKTPYDWISRDEEVVAAYAANPLCTFRFTANGYHELFSVLKEVSGPAWARRINREMPVLIFSGDADPVGAYGKGVAKVHRWLANAGVKDLELILYPGGRHEMLNETNRDEVYRDVLAFLEGRWAPPQNNYRL